MRRRAAMRLMTALRFARPRKGWLAARVLCGVANPFAYNDLAMLL